MSWGLIFGLLSFSTLLSVINGQGIDGVSNDVLMLESVLGGYLASQDARDTARVITDPAQSSDCENLTSQYQDFCTTRHLRFIIIIILHDTAFMSPNQHIY